MSVLPTALVALAIASLAAGALAYRNIKVSSRDAEYARRIGYAARGVAAEPDGGPRTGPGRRFQTLLTSAGIEAPARAALLALIAASVAAGALAGIAFGPGASVLGALAAPAGFLLAVKSAGARRSKSFTRQLADALPVVAQSLRASLSVEAAFGNAAAYMNEPIKGEFSRVANDVRFGRFTIDEAFGRMARRTGNPDVEYLATALAINKEGGGELAGLLDASAERINTKLELRGTVESVTSKGRLAAKIMDAFPFVALALVLFGWPAIGEAFWSSPWWPLAFIVPGALVAIGHLIVHRIYMMPVD